MQTALITGASSGIGADLARAFSRAGYAVILLARRQDRLHALAHALGPGARVVVADLADPTTPGRVFAETGPVDVLVNNAGFGDFVSFAEQDTDRQRDMLQVNVVALTALTTLYLPAMRARGAGRILNVASIVGFMPCPGIALYAATKAFVLSFSEALHSELAGSGVTVTCLAPGSTASEFAEMANMQGKLALRMPMSSAAVAQAGVAATLAGQRLVITGAVNRFNSLLVRLLPRGLVLRGVRKLLMGR